MHGSPKDFGARLRQAMRAKEMTAEELHALGGYSRWYVSCLRTGKRRNPSIAVVADLAQCLGVRAGWLAFGEGEME